MKRILHIEVLLDDDGVVNDSTEVFIIANHNQRGTLDRDMWCSTDHSRSTLKLLHSAIADVLYRVAPKVDNEVRREPKSPPTRQGPPRHGE